MGDFDFDRLGAALPLLSLFVAACTSFWRFWLKKDSCRLCKLLLTSCCFILFLNFCTGKLCAVFFPNATEGVHSKFSKRDCDWRPFLPIKFLSIYGIVWTLLPFKTVVFTVVVGWGLDTCWLILIWFGATWCWELIEERICLALRIYFFFPLLLPGCVELALCICTILRCGLARLLPLLAILEKTSPALVVVGIVNCELGANAFGLLKMEKSAVRFLMYFSAVRRADYNDCFLYFLASNTLRFMLACMFSCCWVFRDDFWSLGEINPCVVVVDRSLAATCID